MSTSTMETSTTPAELPSSSSSSSPSEEKLPRFHSFNASILKTAGEIEHLKERVQNLSHHYVTNRDEIKKLKERGPTCASIYDKKLSTLGEDLYNHEKRLQVVETLVKKYIVDLTETKRDLKCLQHLCKVMEENNNKMTKLAQVIIDPKREPPPLIYVID